MKYVIVGLGKSGRSALALLLETGTPRSEILTFDGKESSADCMDPAAIPASFAKASLVLSPGVPLQTPWIQERLAQGARLTSEIALAHVHLKDERVIGITGSVGKSTTSALLGAGAAVMDPNYFLGANFGVPFCDYALRVIRGGARARWVILELSSFQLENPGPLRPHAAAITSLMPNHLERYSTLDGYYRTKWSLLSLSRGPVVMNVHGGDLRDFASRQGQGNIVWASPADADLEADRLAESRLIGRHNLENLAVAAKLAHLLAWSPEAFQAMRSFTGLEHRLENLGRRGGVLFVNDSKATAMESVLSAVRSCLEVMPAGGRLHLLLGGRDKNLPWKNLSVLGQEPTLEVSFFGECALIAKNGSGLRGPSFGDLATAVAHVAANARSGDTVLLSPGGTSLDEFKSFEERGRRFKKLVEAIQP